MGDANTQAPTPPWAAASASSSNSSPPAPALGNDPRLPGCPGQAPTLSGDVMASVVASRLPFRFPPQELRDNAISTGESQECLHSKSRRGMVFPHCICGHFRVLYTHCGWGGKFFRSKVRPVGAGGSVANAASIYSSSESPAGMSLRGV